MIKKDLSEMKLTIKALQEELNKLNRKKKNFFFRMFTSNIDLISLDALIYRKEKEISSKTEYLRILEQEIAIS